MDKKKGNNVAEEKTVFGDIALTSSANSKSSSLASADESSRIRSNGVQSIMIESKESSSTNNGFKQDGSGEAIDVDLSVEARLKTEVKQDLLGEEPPMGHKRFFYQIDQFSGEQLVRAPKAYNPVNSYFTVLYYIFIISFSV